MEKFLVQLRDGFLRTKWILFTLTILTYFFVILVSGGNLFSMISLWFYVGCYIYFPGVFLAKLGKFTSRFTNLAPPLAIVLGCGFFACLYCFSARLALPWLLVCVPPLCTLSLAIYNIAHRTISVRACKAAILSRMQNGIFACYALLWGFTTALYAFLVSAKNASPLISGSTVYSQDLLWNVGNANSFAIAFPPQDIRFSLVRLSYHYLTELTEGALAIVSNISALDIIAFYMGPVCLLALFVCLVSMGQLYYKGNQTKTLLFVYALFLLNCASGLGVFELGISNFGNTNLQHLTMNINSQASVLIFISIFLSLLIQFTEKNFNVHWLDITLLLCTFVLICFSKGPAAAIFICSFGISMLLYLFQKPNYLKALVCLFACALLFLFIYFAIFSSGANTSMIFTRTGASDTYAWQWLTTTFGFLSLPLVVWLVLAGTINAFCMLPCQMLLYVKGLWRDVRHFNKLSLPCFIANGCAVGGFLAYYLYWHVNSSQIYFALIAIFFLNLLAIDQIDRLRTVLGKALAILTALLGFFTTICLCIVFAGSALSPILSNMGLAEASTSTKITTSADAQAMDWFATQTAIDVQFATNRIDDATDVSSGISNVYSALSGRQAFMEGYSYAITNMGVSAEIVSEKRTVNSALFCADTSAQTITTLCIENEIEYLIYSNRYAGDVSQLASFDCVYQNEEVSIYQIIS